MQADEIEQARSLGVAMGSVWQGAAVGWTTDEAKAGACRDAGLRVTTCYNRTGPAGWEILAAPDPAPAEGSAI
jgi:hypothetical protein